MNDCFCLLGHVFFPLGLLKKNVFPVIGTRGARGEPLPSGSSALVAVIMGLFSHVNSLPQQPLAAWPHLQLVVSARPHKWPPTPSLPLHPGSGLSFVHCAKMSS